MLKLSLKEGQYVSFRFAGSGSLLDLAIFSSFGASISNRQCFPIPPANTIRISSPMFTYCPSFNDNLSIFYLHALGNSFVHAFPNNVTFCSKMLHFSWIDNGSKKEVD